MYLSTQFAWALPLPKSLGPMLETAKSIYVFEILNFVRKRIHFEIIQYGDLATFLCLKYKLKCFGNRIDTCPQTKRKGVDQLIWARRTEFWIFSKANCLESSGFSKLCFNLNAKCGTMDEIHIVNDTKCDIPSSEIFRILLPDIRYIKMRYQEVRLGGGAWTGLIWLRIRTSNGLFLVSSVINLQVP